MAAADPNSSPISDEARETLMRAALIISAFRNRLAIAGYPFMEPPEAKRVLFEIDSICHPPEKTDRRRK